MNLIKKISFCLAFYLVVCTKVYANIIYEKDDILITDLEVEVFIDFFINDYSLKESEAIKQIYLIKRLVKNLKKFDPQYLKNIDTAINSEQDQLLLENEPLYNALIFNIIRNDFIIDYIINYLSVEDLNTIFQDYTEVKIPISQNGCLIYSDMISISNNENLIRFIYDLIKQNNIQNNSISINEKSYSICIDKNIYQKINNIVFDQIKAETKTDFENYLYKAYYEQ